MIGQLAKINKFIWVFVVVAGLVSAAGGYTMGVSGRIPSVTTQNALMIPTPTIEVIRLNAIKDAFPSLIFQGASPPPVSGGESVIATPPFSEGNLPVVSSSPGIEDYGVVSDMGGYTLSFSEIDGTVFTSYNGLEHIDIVLNKWNKNQRLNLFKINSSGQLQPEGIKTRLISKPKTGVQYNYAFNNLDPNTIYIVNVLMCSKNDCITKVNPISCSGMIDSNNSEGCVTSVPGKADFILEEWPAVDPTKQQK